MVFLPSATESVEANGDTRTISLFHSHTNESIEATYRVNGHYDQAVLDQLNWFLRDWRNDQQTKMDPRLFDVVWETYRAAGATQPIVVFSAYRSPETNAMLRRRSRSVAEFSQHMLGKAMDTTMPGMPMEKIREIGMRMQRGGVGFYPSSNFVHLDVGSVRHWPRMSYDQLVRLFPDGKTVHIAANGQKLARYEEARAEIEANGGVAATLAEQNTGCFFGWLFGCRDEGEDTRMAHNVPPSPVKVKQTQIASLQPAPSQPPMSWPQAKPISSIVPSYAANPIVAATARPEMEWNSKPLKPLSPDQRNEAKPTQKAIFANVPVPPKPDQKLLASLTSPSRNFDPAFVKHEETLQVRLPVPPPRPAALTASGDIPTPPMKPLSYAALISSLPAARFDAETPEKAMPINRLLTKSVDKASLQRAASLPVIITQGSAQGVKHAVSISQNGHVPEGILAYAPEVQTQGFRSVADAKVALNEGSPQMIDPARNASRVAAKTAPVVAARLDRSNFKTLTADTRFTENPGRLGAGPLALRSSARGSTDLLDGTPPANGEVMVFAAKATDLETDHFSGKLSGRQTVPESN